MKLPPPASPLRACRKRLNLTMQMVCDEIGMDTGSYSRLERMKQGATPETAEKLVKALGRENITEMQILYPERYMKRSRAKGAEAKP